MSEPGNRYAVLTPNNQSANIWVCSIIAVAFAAACLFSRLMIRSRLGHHIGLDDYVFGGAWVIQAIQVGLLLKATALGLGQDDSLVDKNNVSSIQTYTAASLVLTVVAIYTAKVSMILLIGRLFTKQLYPYWVVIAVFGVVAAIQMEAGCVYPSCTNVAPRFYVNAAFDIATEIIVIALPIYCIQDVRMRRNRKLKVLATFSSRSLLILFVGLIIWAASRIREIGRLTTSIVLPIILLQLELSLSLCICAIIPCFRTLFQSSDIVLTDSAEISRETKRAPSNGSRNRLRSYGRNTDGSGIDTQISYVRQPTPPPPEIKKPEHAAQRSQDTTGSTSHTTGRPSEGRASESSLVPSATTGLSIKPLVQAPVP